MQTKHYKDFCPTKQTKIVALCFGDFLLSVGSFFGYDPQGGVQIHPSTNLLGKTINLKVNLQFRSLKIVTNQ